MTRHAHTIRLPSCTVSLGPHTKLLAQETKAYTLLKPWDCVLDRHIAMVSVFRSLAFCDSLRRLCTQDSALRNLPERIGTGFLCTLRSSKPRASLSLEIRASQANVLICTRYSGRFKENSTNEIRLLKSWPGIQNIFLCIGGPCHCSFNYGYARKEGMTRERKEK